MDMTTREPLDLTVKKMDRVMDEIEKILDRQKAGSQKTTIGG